MSSIKETYDFLVNLGNKILKLPENVGKYKQGAIVSISGQFAWPIFLEAYGEVEEATFQDVENAKLENIPALDLKYSLDNNDKLNAALKKHQEENKTFDQLKKDVNFELFISKDRLNATEMLVSYFSKHNYVYAVRNDEKKEIWIYKDGIYVENGASYIQEFVRQVLGAAYTTQLKNQVIEKIEADNLIESHTLFEYNQDLDFIPVQNGLLNIRTKKLSDFTPEKIFFAKLPVHYDKKAKCPKIKEFIKEICGDLKDVETVQQFIGSCLYREQRWEKMLMCIGGGRNGKSKLAELVKNFLGAENVTGLQPSSFEDPENFQTHMLHTCLANMYMDISKNAFKNTSLLKSLSGRETITVPRKHKTAITFKNSAKFIFGANELPMSYDISSGFWGRWLLINLPYTFVYETELETIDKKEKNKYKIRNDDIIEQICTQEEINGLLNWVLDGLQQLFKKGGYSYKYTTEEVKIQWIKKSDSFMAFHMDCCVESYESKISKQELQKAYIWYCKENRLKISHPKRINNALSELGCYDGRHKGKSEDFYYWENVDLKSLYKGTTDVDGFATFKQPSLRDKIYNFVKSQEICRIQDLTLRFEKKVLDKMLQQGELIEHKAGEVKINDNS